MKRQKKTLKNRAFKFWLSVQNYISSKFNSALNPDRSVVVEEISLNIAEQIIKGKINGSSLTALEMTTVLKNLKASVQTELERRKVVLQSETEETVTALRNI